MAWLAWDVVYRVFAQTSEVRLDLAALLQSARRFFEATVEVLEEQGVVVTPTSAPVLAPWVRLRIISERQGYSAVVRVSCRAANVEDWRAAQQAEERGRAAGMGALARRCASLWLVEAEPGSSEAAVLNLCGVLASVGLGPVLPPDGSTLFGVRGAMARVEALTAPSLFR